MKLVVKFRIQDEKKEELYDRLYTAYFRVGFVRKVKNAVVVEVPENVKFRLHEKFANLNPEYKALVSEYGGATSRTGCGTVVCSPQGETLVPLRLEKTANGDQAIFVGDYKDFIIITALRTSKKIIIEQPLINKGNDEDGDYYVARTRELWEGLYEELPPEYEIFKDAIEAAITKSRCYHCKRAHFYRLKE